jgi:deoxyribodipyrimidine photolyase
MRTARCWIRRDLRLGDNQALAAALRQAEQVMPPFVLDPALLASPWVGERRLAFLYDGLQHFMQHLLDGDPAANNGGWHWAAGTGTDAAPTFRVLNPVLQGMKFDPDGAYVRRFVAEPAKVPEKYIHNPWTMPMDVQRKTPCLIGRDYPAPLVDHKLARERVLLAYKAQPSKVNRGRPVRQASV